MTTMRLIFVALDLTLVLQLVTQVPSVVSQYNETTDKLTSKTEETAAFTESISGRSPIQMPKTEPTFCGKPPFWKNKCTSNVFPANLMMRYSKLPFDLWLYVHIEIQPDAKNLMKVMKKDPDFRFSEVAVGITNMQGFMVGQFSASIPCQNEDVRLQNLLPMAIKDKDKDAGNKSIQVYQCARVKHLQKDTMATTTYISFPKPVIGFYFAYKFTPEEWASITFPEPSQRPGLPSSQNTGFQVITLIKDDNGTCFFNVLSKYAGLDISTGSTTNEDIKPPFKCHEAGKVDEMTGKLDSFPLPPWPAKIPYDLEVLKKRHVKIPILAVNPHRPTANEPKLNESLQKLTEAYILDKYTTESITTGTELPIRVTEIVPLVVINGTRPPPFIPADLVDEIKAVNMKQIDNRVTKESRKDKLYYECGHTRGCIGEPAGCIKTKDCHTLVSYTRKKNKVEFELLGRTAKYIALGLSEDGLMGTDSVIECVREDDYKVQAYMSYNLPAPERVNTRLESQEGFKFQEGYYVDGELYCSYSREKEYLFNNHLFDLKREKYYFLIVLGNTAMNGKKGHLHYHEKIIVTRGGQIVYRYVGTDPSQMLLIKIHSVIMIIVWIVIVPNGALLARYFKDTFLNSSIGYGQRQYSIWFGVHFLAMVSTLLLITGCTAALYINDPRARKLESKNKTNDFLAASNESDSGGVIENDKGKRNVVADEVDTSRSWSEHEIFGMGIILLALAQGPLGVMILKYNTAVHKQLRINYIHGLNGHILFFAAFTCIWKSRNLRNGLPCSSGHLLIGWMCTYMILHLAMSYQVCYSDFIQGRRVSRAYTIGALDIPDRNNDGQEEPGATGRRVLLVCFVCLSIIFAIALSVQYLTSDVLDCVNYKKAIANAAKPKGVLD